MENMLLELSETDALTGINNRGSGEAKIDSSLANGKMGLFCILDVDDFGKSKMIDIKCDVDKD